MNKSYNLCSEWTITSDFSTAFAMDGYLIWIQFAHPFSSISVVVAMDGYLLWIHVHYIAVL